MRTLLLPFVLFWIMAALPVAVLLVVSLLR
jgi:hypothetical protein